MAILCRVHGSARRRPQSMNYRLITDESLMIDKFFNPILRLMKRAGWPIAIEYGGISFVTTD
jgi:hypothetical protein